MPMTVEVCADCGCNEFCHSPRVDPCGEDCPPDCPGHPVDDQYVCDCGECDDYRFVDDPEGDGSDWPVDADGAIRVDWLAEPLEVVGALVEDASGLPTRVGGVPDEDQEILVLFARTTDGLEVTIARDELV